MLLSGDHTKGILVGDDVALGQHLIAEDGVRLELKLHTQKKQISVLNKQDSSFDSVEKHIKGKKKTALSMPQKCVCE